jgi:hypothetical protein
MKKYQFDVAATDAFIQRVISKKSTSEILIDATPPGITNVEVTNRPSAERNLPTPDGITTYTFSNPYPSESESKNIIYEIQTQINQSRL